MISGVVDALQTGQDFVESELYSSAISAGLDRSDLVKQVCAD